MPPKVTQLLREDGYSLQGNRKTEEGDDHPDRDAQFQHINRAVKRALRAGEPVISVDTKKKELIGNYQNQGRQWRKTGTADKVNGHDFPGPEVPRAYPYGIYDLGRNVGPRTPSDVLAGLTGSAARYRYFSPAWKSSMVAPFRMWGYTGQAGGSQTFGQAVAYRRLKIDLVMARSKPVVVASR